jgi:hypothetical protein
MARMTALRQTAESRAGLHKPGSRTLYVHLFLALDQLKNVQNLNTQVCQNFFKKIF